MEAAIWATWGVKFRFLPTVRNDRLGAGDNQKAALPNNNQKKPIPSFPRRRESRNPVQFNRRLLPNPSGFRLKAGMTV